MAQRLLVDAYGEINWVGCDCCGDMVDKDLTVHGYPYGIETTACDRCAGYDAGDVAAELHGTGYPSAADPYNHYYEKVVCYPREVV